MKYFLIIIVWFVIFIIDGIVIPGLTNWPAGFGAIVSLAALVTIFGAHRWVIGLGLVLAGISELMVGAYFGTIIGAWLAMVWSWYFLNMFLNIKSMTEGRSALGIPPLVLLSLGIFIVGEGVMWLIIRFVYQSGLSLSNLTNILSSPTILIAIIIELGVVIANFHLINSSQNHNYG